MKENLFWGGELCDPNTIFKLFLKNLQYLNIMFNTTPHILIPDSPLNYDMSTW